MTKDDIKIFLDAIQQAPLPFNLARANQYLEDLKLLANECNEPSGDQILALLADGRARPLLTGIFGNSPFLTRTIMKEAIWLPELFNGDLTLILDDILTALDEQAIGEAPHEQLMQVLRQAKRRTALLIALADVSDIWTDHHITEAITRFADMAVSTTIRRLLLDAHRRGELELPDPRQPDIGSGLALIAMGKQGAFELNYSSDIDFVIYYDQDVTRYVGRKTVQQCFIRMAMNLVKIMQEVTADGYVLRTDLRLRPDPGVTPVVVSMQAAESYYESMGQNWERAAMIKARPFAGDLAAGEAFLERLQPFIWRRNLDFAAIEDVHSIKRQIHDHKGHSAIAVAGHNIKVGRGGIRDIEFFVQTQQLIAGGRDVGLRGRGTIEAMNALRDAGWIDAEITAEMTQAYHFHRRVEHRLQMIGDEQTHSIGRNVEDVDHIACFLGYRETSEFEAELLQQLNVVQRHYRALFEDHDSLTENGNLVFTGTEDDPDTLSSLEKMGYSEPKAASNLVRGWHHGRYRALKSARSRELLTKLVPTLLDVFAATSDANAALNRFDQFLAGLPAGVQLFSLLTANPGLLEMLAELIGNAPKLASYLSRNAPVLDAVLSGDFWEPMPAVGELRKSLGAGLRLAHNYEECLDIVRRFVKERKFQMGVQIVRGVSDADRNGRGLSDLAEAAIAELLPLVNNEFSERERRGSVANGRMIVLAMGKFGSYEMTETSDLDLVFVYDYDPDVSQSDGDRPLAPPHYFGRLSQRLLNALTAATAEGSMYEVDMRLRPSGNKGPAATHFDGFRDYHEEEAWTWEHMALTRARVVAGDRDLASRVEQVIHDVLTRQRDSIKIASDAASMRARIFDDRGTDNPWRIKQVRGGLIDQEFIGQFLQLTHASDHPEILSQNNRQAIRNLMASGLIANEQAEALIDASMLLSNLSAFARVAVEGEFEPDKASPGLRHAISRASNCGSFAELEAQVIAAEAKAKELFDVFIQAKAN